MSAKSTKASQVVRYESLDQLPAAPPLNETTKSLSDTEIERRANADPDLGELSADFWDEAAITEPEGTEQITLRLPRRVVRHFKATGKGYQTRISAVLSSYVDASLKKKAR